MSHRILGGLLAFLFMAPFSSASATDLVGSGGVGARAGSLLFLLDEQIKDEAEPRLAGDLVFTYVYNDHVSLDLTMGYGWNRLDSGTDDFWLASSVPLTLTGRYFIRDGRTWRPYVGAGGGAYIWTIHSKDLGAAKDPVTFERLRRADLGIHGLVGVERRMSKHIAMTGDGAYHVIFAKNLEDFPSAYYGNKSYFQVRVGVSFFFSLSERIDTGLPG